MDSYPRNDSGAPISGALDLTYRLEDRYLRTAGRVFMSGTQALVRALLTQARNDSESGLKTAGFISGYRGSPLGAVDMQLWRAKTLLDAHSIRFLPAINEELGATAVLGTQRVEADADRAVDGVFSMWYGKGPGVDRAGDALRHGNAYGSSPHGGVVVVLGDDHGCVSSSMPHQSDFVVSAWGMPVLNPASVAEMIEFALYGWALSRFSGAWVGMKAISETVESAASVDLDSISQVFAPPTGFTQPAGGLHNRWPDLPSLAIEARLAHKLAAVRVFARTHSLDRVITSPARADLAIVTCGKAHLDLLEALRRLDLSCDDLGLAGIRIYKVGLAYPLDTERLESFCAGIRELLVVEEKGGFVEQQLRNHFYNRPDGQRPLILGKLDLAGATLFAASGELRPSRVMPAFAEWLARHRPALDRRHRVVDFTAPQVLSNAADGVRRTPYFCSGCPHNTSTRIPDGSVAHAGIGCHFMASWMERDTVGLIQMGGEGADWAGQAPFMKHKHIFQNLGDGTYFHSGILAIRQAIAAQATMTYKILYNDAVAMTGGQPVDGSISVAQIARQVEAEGVTRLCIVSNDIAKFEGEEERFPPGTSFHDRSELDAVQRELREIGGVTVLIYDQTCAAELRRRRKKGEVHDPARRLFINADVCEGCGDCGVQSNCLSIEPLETPAGRKRRINQSSCNKDYSCVNGFCPSFVSVTGAKPHKAVGIEFDESALLARAAALPQPSSRLHEAPYDMLVTGVGGTGVVTIGALVSMAAHLEGRCASVLDFMGFAQKGGSVLSFVRFATRPELLNQVRIDTQQADFILACDLVVGASQDALQTVRRERTRLVVNDHEVANDTFVRHPDAQLHAPELFEKMRHAAGDEFIERCDGHSLALQFLGDAMGENVLLLGFAWQRGLVPVSFAALDRAIELNGVAVKANRLAFSIGRLAAADPAALEELAHGTTRSALAASDDLASVIAATEAHLASYQSRALSGYYRELVDIARAAEQRAMGNAGPLTLAVARQYGRLLAYKDEYEVARLYADGRFTSALAAEFEGRPGRDYRIDFHMAPPLIARKGSDGLPRKITIGPWLAPALSLLSRLRGLRGSLFDPFGWTLERRVERQLARDYRERLLEACATLTPERLEASVELARVPEKIRGFGHVKLNNLVVARQHETQLLQSLGISGADHGAIAVAIKHARAHGPSEARIIAIRRAPS
jgi:indolepyruvate ferredoxin oxidoreductase